MSAFPSSQFKAIGFKSIDPTLVSYSQSGKRVVRKVSGGHKWEFTLSFPPMTKAQFKPILGFIASVRGQYSTFTVIPPNLKTPSGTQTADTTVGANASAGSTSVQLTGGTYLNTIVSGDVIKFSNHDKVYAITADATFDVSGNATISIIPPLTSDITTAHTAKHSNVPFTVALKNSVQEYAARVDGYYTYELDVEEDI